MTFCWHPLGLGQSSSSGSYAKNCQNHHPCQPRLMARERRRAKPGRARRLIRSEQDAQRRATVRPPHADQARTRSTAKTGERHRDRNRQLSLHGGAGCLRLHQKQVRSGSLGNRNRRPRPNASQARRGLPQPAEPRPSSPRPRLPRRKHNRGRQAATKLITRARGCRIS